jgi:glycine/D-amino acid oxidase-like deaminating enzyme
MGQSSHGRTFSETALRAAAWMGAQTWPAAGRIFREKLEFDENESLWVSQTPDYRPSDPLRKDIGADLAIIGGGFTGVSTAYHFSRRYPEKRVVLLEAKALANGASGRNGGMMLNWLPIMYGYDAETTRRVYEMTHAGIRMIAEIIERHGLPVSYRIDGTLSVYTDPRRAEAAQREAELHQQLGIPSIFLDGEALKQKVKMEGVYGAILDPNSGQINGAQLVRSLRPVLEAQGVAIYEQTPVLSIREGVEMTLRTPAGEVRAKAVVLATNGYTSKLGYFRDAIFPLHAHVFATAPQSAEELDKLGWHGTAGYSDDLDRIAYSSLTREGQIVFGGGSNQAYAYLFNDRTRYTQSLQTAARAQQKLRETMGGYLPRSRDIPVTHRWTGVLGMTMNRVPLMGVRGANRNLYYAVGFCGHGVTLGNMAGLILTDAYSGDDARWRGLPCYQADYVRIPPEPFRWIGYQVFTRLTGKSPRL